MRAYRSVADLGIVTSYFNPCGFRGRHENFTRFLEPIRESGIPIVVVEGRYEGGLTLSPDVGALGVEVRDVLWQKERLLHLGSGHLPDRCRKVAWLDADVIFERDDWAVEASRMLDDVAVLQPFREAVRLARGSTDASASDAIYEGFGHVRATRPDELAKGRFESHGHTGFAWAARRDLLARRGLYDACIAGSGDHIMAHAFAGDADSPCIARMLGTGGPHRAHFRRWSRTLQAEVQGRVGFVEGRLLHLWHGSIENRRYMQRNKELRALAFDPAVDIRISAAGAWEWARERPELHAWARRYFEERREDDDEPAVVAGETRAS